MSLLRYEILTLVSLGLFSECANISLQYKGGEAAVNQIIQHFFIAGMSVHSTCKRLGSYVGRYLTLIQCNY